MAISVIPATLLFPYLKTTPTARHPTTIEQVQKRATKFILGDYSSQILSQISAFTGTLAYNYVHPTTQCYSVFHRKSQAIIRSL